MLFGITAILGAWYETVLLSLARVSNICYGCGKKGWWDHWPKRLDALCQPTMSVHRRHILVYQTNTSIQMRPRYLSLSPRTSTTRIHLSLI
jgi:hypothetical protein